MIGLLNTLLTVVWIICKVFHQTCFPMSSQSFALLLHTVQKHSDSQPKIHKGSSRWKRPPYSHWINLSNTAILSLSLLNSAQNLRGCPVQWPCGSAGTLMYGQRAYKELACKGIVPELHQGSQQKWKRWWPYESWLCDQSTSEILGHTSMRKSYVHTNECT